MARLALTVGGQIIGNAILPGIGGAIGGAIGGVAGALLFPPPPTYGPKPGDTTVAPGTYGNPIAIAYGLSDISCDLIWVKGNKKDVVKKKHSTGAKGLGGPTYVTYEQFATFAVLICDGPISGLRRLYFGKELVFDGTAEAIQAAIASGDPLPLTGAIEGITFRLYTGTADQAPDPAIQAEDPNAPAWRGMSYMVFEDVPLEKWGNAIPGDGVPVIVEVATSPVVRPHTAGTSTGRVNGLTILFEPTRRRFFRYTDGSLTIQVYDPLTMVQTRTDNITGATNVWRSAAYGTLDHQLEFVGATNVSGQYNVSDPACPPALAPDGSFYVMSEHVNRAPGSQMGWGAGLVVDAETGGWIATISTDLNLSFNVRLGYRSARHHVVRAVDWLLPDPLTGVQPFLYLRSNFNREIFWGAVSAASRGAVHGTGYAKVPDAGLAGIDPLCVDIDQAGETIFAAYINKTTRDHEVARIPAGRPRATSAGDFDATAYVPDLTATVSPSFGSILDILYDNDNDTVCVIGSNNLVVFDRDLNEIGRLDTSQLRTDSRARGRAGVIDGILWFAAAASASSGAVKDRFIAVSTADASIVETYELSDWGLNDDNEFGPIFKLRQDMWVTHAGDSAGGAETYAREFVALYGDRLELAKINLKDVLQDMAERAGLATSDLDLTAVTRQIWGCPQKAANVTARGAWEDLLFQTGHDAMMLDGKIVVRPQAGSSTGTIDDDDLGADGGWALKRVSDSSDPPRRVELSYRSVPANLEPAIQSDEFPVEVVPDGKVQRFETALRMDDDEAWATVQRFLSQASAERTRVEISVPYTRGDIEPGQIWTISADGGNHDVRIREIDGDRVLSIKGERAWPFLVSAGTPIDTTRPAPSLAEIPATDYALIDSHIWRDEDDSAAFHVTGWPRRAGLAWEGGVVYRGSDAVSIDQEFAAITDAATAGAAKNALGDVPSCNFWDRGNTLTVWMLSGTPDSATEADVLAGANPVWVACGATGEWELIQYATATENADGSWTLSNLLRGRRGTEHLTDAHTVGDKVVWADATAVVRRGGSQTGTELHYITASVGSSQDPTTRRALTNRARSLRPYSVVQVAGTRDGSDNLDVTWVRRSRLAGDPSQTNRPLGEDSEEYEADIIDGSGDVVRSFTGLTSPALTYTAADQTTDFGSPQASVTLKIYQISATVGRGIEKEATV